MRFGFTTGSCAAAAAKAAAYMLLTGMHKNQITIMTPKGIPFVADLVEITKSENQVSCAVIKDGGDDPDVTTGAHVFAKVSYGSEKNQPDNMNSKQSENYPKVDAGQMDATIWIDGGIGVGRVTKPGLDQPVGNAAINHVPREMITEEVQQVCRLCDYKGILQVEISIPEGVELAAKTFNPRLGIVGGISVLGTSGIVEPMSSQALLDTIRVELNQKKALGMQAVPVSPGNYGLDFMRETYAFDLDKSVKCSNFIGDTIDMAAELGFEKMLLTGHIGKLIKVAGGLMNTHSKEGDCRMELLTSCGILAGCDLESAKEILGSVSTTEGIRILQDAGEGILEKTMEIVVDRICFYLRKRAADRILVEVIVYDNQYGLLGLSGGALDFLEDCR